MGGRGSSSSKAKNGGGSAKAEKPIEDRFREIIGNGRTGASELDMAKTLQQVEEINSKMQNIISSDKTLDKQGKLTYQDSVKRRVDDATIRVSPISNKKEMISFIKKQTGIDVGKYLEERTSRSRRYLGIHIENMSKSEQAQLRELMAKKGVRIGENGGFGYALEYKK